MASVIGRYLLRSEVCVAIVRRHWAVLLPQGSVIALAWIVWAVILDASVGSFIQTIAAFFYIFSGAWFGWLVGEWYIEQFVVTDKRILLVTGLFYRKLAVMPLAKVTDLTYERSPLGRLLGYGTFIMESAGQDQALSKVEFLRNPDRLYHRLSQQLFGPGGRDAGDGLNWIPNEPEPPADPAQAGTTHLPPVR
jgi:membrane protein YdbS with pleckstrin-like domain